MKLASLSAAVAALTLVCGVTAASAVTITMNNRSSATMTSLRTGETSNPNWGPNILEGRIAPGEAAEVTIPDELPGCRYDFRADFSDGSVLDTRNVDICALDGGELDISDQ